MGMLRMPCVLHTQSANTSPIEHVEEHACQLPIGPGIMSSLVMPLVGKAQGVADVPTKVGILQQF